MHLDGIVLPIKLELSWPWGMRKIERHMTDDMSDATKHGDIVCGQCNRKEGILVLGGFTQGLSF